MVVGQLFCQLYTTVITMKCLSNNQTLKYYMQYAFCDEFGAFGFTFEKPNVSTHFIITAIIVNDSDMPALRDSVEAVRKKHFQTGEMKSSHLKNNHTRIRKLLDDLMPLPFNIYYLVVDKRKIYEQSGLRIKTSFYKFLNQMAYNALQKSFQKLTIVADETGSNEFMQSFSEYIKDHNPALSLFDEFNFRFNKSEHGVLIQLADIMSGCLAFCYDENKKSKAEGSNYKTYLGKKIIGIQEFPRDPVTFRVEDQINFDSRDDATVANLCLRKALAFKQEFKNKDADENSKMQIAVLDYLLFRFMNNSVRRYISTQELQNDLERKGFERLSTQSFRNRIIAKLRDHGVIIASSNKGYKLPSKKSEVEDFIKKTQGIIEPMLHRLKLCYNAIRLGSNGTIFMLDDPEYSTLKKLIEVE